MKNLDKLYWLRDQFNRGASGNADYFAKRMDISTRTFYRYLDILRDYHKMDIKYSRRQKTYFFESDENK